MTRKQKMKIHPDGVGASMYARKKAWLNGHSVEIPAGIDEDGEPKFETRVPFGFQVAEPKPWK